MKTQLLTVKEAAGRLAIEEVTLRQWIAHGHIHSLKLGRARRIPELELERIAEEGLADASTHRGPKAEAIPAA